MLVIVILFRFDEQLKHDVAGAEQIFIAFMDIQLQVELVILLRRNLNLLGARNIQFFHLSVFIVQLEKSFQPGAAQVSVV